MPKRKADLRYDSNSENDEESDIISEMSSVSRPRKRRNKSEETSFQKSYLKSQDLEVSLIIARNQRVLVKDLDWHCVKNRDYSICLSEHLTQFY